LTRYSNQNHTKIGIKKEDALAPLLISCKNYEKLIKIFSKIKICIFKLVKTSIQQAIRLLSMFRKPKFFVVVAFILQSET
jgi:hypothetical protein